MRWRGSFKTVIDDVGDDAVKVPPHVFGGDADRFHSLLASPSVASLIASRVVAEVKGQAVYLDRDTSGLAKKSNTNGPKGCCLRNCNPSGRRRSTFQSLISEGLMRLRS